jgi:hypothetical protein
LELERPKMVRMAVPEIRRMMPDVLRMVGIPLGQAEICAELATWTEAARGGTITFLREHRERLQWIPRPRPAVLADEPDAFIVDARGGSWLEFGPAILSFAEAHASRGGSMAGSVRHIFGEVFLPYLSVAAARHGYEFEARPVNASGTDSPRPHADAPGEYRVHCALSAEPRPAQAEEAHYRAALLSGFDIPEEDFLYFRSLHEMLRVPTSERSRSHAG